MSDEQEVGACPICSKNFPINDLVKHVDTCLFLNSKGDDKQKRKREESPVKKPKFNFKQKSPKAPSFAPIFQRNKPSTSQANNNNNSDDNVTKETSMSFQVPLAKQVQPKSLDEFFGQNHVLGDKTVLKSLLEKAEIPNMILWGPPGCGKTSLAGVINEICKQNPKTLKFRTGSAADDGVKLVRTIITESKNDIKFGKRTVLFMDEIHRFNKKQQDSFLLSVEKGEIILVGATTENPSFCINNALLSRCRVIVMEKLSSEDLYYILIRGCEKMEVDVVDQDNPCGVLEGESIAIEKSALEWLADISDGDARIALSNLQITLQHCNEKGKIIKIEDIKEGVKKSHMLYDRKGEEHYNIISAMHKSIRGSDPNAALYWTTRMIVGGEDPLFIARRMVRAASEDIGNADPNALQLAVSTMQGCQLLGMPEADVLLAQCAIYLARAPKSREADSALGEAKRLINNHKGPQPNVPLHIRNAPTKLMKDLGYGRRNGRTDLSFMPPELEDVNFFN